MLRRFIGRVDSREVRQLAAAGFAVEALRVPLLGHLQRRVDPHLQELLGSNRDRAIARSARNGEMNDTITISPASTINRATSATRRMFSTRSAAVKPRSELRPWRTLSPSSR